MEDSEFFQMMIQVHQSVGRIEEGQKNIKEYADAISRRVVMAEVKLDEHIEDIEAHGEKARSGVWEFVGKLMAVICGAIPILWWILKLVQGSALKP